MILTDILQNVNLGKVSDPTLGAPPTTRRTWYSVKNMKNNKSSSIDGITAEFLLGKIKVFYL